MVAVHLHDFLEILLLGRTQSETKIFDVCEKVPFVRMVPFCKIHNEMARLGRKLFKGWTSVRSGQSEIKHTMLKYLGCSFALVSEDIDLMRVLSHPTRDCSQVQPSPSSGESIHT